MIRLFNTDTTSFLALESSFSQEKSQPIDPAASEIGATLFDAIVNATTLDLLVAVESTNESLKSRLSDSYKYLKATCDKYGTLGRCRLLTSRHGASSAHYCLRFRCSHWSR
jgi:hypothetical protein